MNNILFILLIIGFVVLFIYIKRKFKYPKVGSICMITGGVKTGKTTFCVAMAIKQYKRILRKIKFVNLIRRILKRKEFELPLLYSNIPLSGISYVPLTRDLLLRKKRFAYKSVVILSEYSLVADSQLIKDKTLNHELLMFCKLFGHETHGGTCFIDSQCISDCHYAVKRVLSDYFYIHSIVKWLPFFVLARVRENSYSEDNNTINVNSEDIENTLKPVLIPKSTWKRFDAFCYSSFTDNLPVEEIKRYNLKGRSLKAKNIVSFNSLITSETENISNE